jgi:hypothetical protein
VICTLTPADITYCDGIARRRTDAAVRKHRVGVNGGPTGVLAVDRLGVYGEFAAKRFFDPVKWHDYSDGEVTGLPDLDDFIDVKTAHHAWHKLVVQRNSNERFAYLLVYPIDACTFNICGWIWGHEAMDPGYWSDPVGWRPAYFVPQQRLYNLPSLFSILRERQAKRGG